MNDRFAPAFRLGLVASLAALLGLFGAANAAEEPPLKLVQTIPLKGVNGKLDHLCLDANGQRLFIANKANNTLDVADLKSGAMTKQIAGQQGVQGVAYAPDLDRVFAGLGGGGFCNIFDGKDQKLLKSIKFKDDADNVRYDPRTQTVYVVHAETALGVIDAKTYEVKADIKLPGAGEGMAIETGRPRLYVAVPSPCQVVAIDLAKNEVVGAFPLTAAGECHPVALDEANHRIFIGCRKQPMVIVLDSENGKQVATLPIPGEVDDLHYDAGRKALYASCGEGFLAVIRQSDADHYTAAEKVPTAKGGKTSCYDPAAGKLYVAVPKQPGKSGPEVQVYQIQR